MTTITATHSGSIRLLVAATAVVGILGIPTAMLFGEPYPWIMMPGFGGAAGFDGQVVQRSTALFTVTFEDGGARTLRAPEVFSEVPSSNYAVLTKGFAPDDRGGHRLEHLVASVVPNVHRAARSGSVRNDDPELRQWLRRQVVRMFPDRRPRYVDVHWHRATIDRSGTEEIRDSEHIMRIEL